ncbi:MAG: SUMF1/EgtB/PvdO family nonheme iron enzyme [Odoribacter sp.]|nr:SUMF1/EgtB/PvdO family nonheme iron enzyme [Odoribacter sp.]
MISSECAGKWFEPTPKGMLLIPTGNLIIGQNDEDIAWTMTATQRTVSIPTFWMDETEITNAQYRQFVNWVVDSIKRQHLVDAGNTDFLKKDKNGGNTLEPPQLDYKVRIDMQKNENFRELFSVMEYQGEDRLTGGDLDVRRLIYKFSWYDYTQAALNDKFYNPETGNYDGGYVINVKGEREPVVGCSSFIMRKDVAIYPDTLCWIKDFTYSYNEPYVKEYFSHRGYDNYPVVGVSWYQAQAFCFWRTQYFKEYNPGKDVHAWRLPSESEWEYVARGGLIGQKYPWGGPYIPVRKGKFLANFKPSRGNYSGDGGTITVPVGSYEPNGYGLYDMAGNVAEWTAENYDESSYSVTHDMNPFYHVKPTDNPDRVFRRKVVRGGSWKDIAFFLQNGVRSYEYEDSTRSYIGFRTVRTRIEF